MAKRGGGYNLCAALYCNHNRKRNPNLSFFRFPKNPKVSLALQSPTMTTLPPPTILTLAPMTDLNILLLYSLTAQITRTVGPRTTHLTQATMIPVPHPRSKGKGRVGTLQINSKKTTWRLVN
uniref:Uncharacterized protein n=1 Tax=Cacopsylla melanoneura TaxID=428564 RepID=A0A8D9BAL2_9HEMI